MASEDRPPGPSERPDGAAGALLARPRLLAVVQVRWSRPVTAVIAGAGFGKTTLLDQAMAADGPANGIDVALRVEPGDASGVRLASRLLAALSVESNLFAGEGELLDLLVDELWARAPSPVCLVLDDLHEIAPDSGGTRLLRDLVRRLPGNSHLLVGSRRLPEIGIARLAVARQAEVVREADLRFTPEELTEFARRRNVDPELLRPADGWPALAELLARSRGVDASDYVREEVIGMIDDDERGCVVDLAAVGRADDGMASALADRDVQLATVLVDVPLARRDAAGAWELHEVIATTVLEGESPARIADIRRRGGQYARVHGDLDLAMRLFTAAGARDDAIAVLRDQFVRPANQEDPTLAGRWLVLLDPELLGEPEAILAQAVAASVGDPEHAFALGERAAQAFGTRDDVEGEVAALVQLGGLAYALLDRARILPYFPRIAELATTGHPWAVALDALRVGAFSVAMGDWRQACVALSPLVADPHGDPTQGVAAWLCARALVRGGRLQEAGALIDRMPESHRAVMRDGVLAIQVMVAQGLGAADEVLEELRAIVESRVDRRPAITRRVARCRLAFGVVCAGDVAGARHHLAELALLGPTTDATRDDELFATAAVEIASGDEPTATRLLAQIPDRGVFFPPLDGLVLFYVLRPELRARYDALDLEGVHAQRRDFAAAFVAARDGDTGRIREFSWPRLEVVRWFAPAAWLVEAMTRASAAGARPDASLWNALGPTQRDVLRRLQTDADPSVAVAAEQREATLGPAAPGRVSISALGELEIVVDGSGIDNALFRRERVRALLGLLVVRRSVRRTEAAATLWPDRGDDTGNLRVTLNYLLKLLEPDRHAKAPSFFVRQDRDHLMLVHDPALTVDLWEFEAAIVRAADAERSAAPSGVLDALVPAVERWRGPLLADLGASEWLDFERLRLTTTYVRSALRAGELLAADHELDGAETMAGRVITVDPWNEAAYRLLASVQLERGARSGAREVLEHLRTRLLELGLTPDPATIDLLERCVHAR
jgi:LuxR family maltose regulon positive regulatory protein